MGSDVRDDLPFDLPGENSEEIETVLDDPHGVNFRPGEQDWIELYPDHLDFREAEVDLENKNVTLRTNMQSSQERYTTVISREDYSLVESQAEVHLKGKAGLSVTYYLVKGDDVFMYDGSGWEETYNPGVVDVADLTPDIYEQALEFGEPVEEEDEQEDYVPPPEESFFTD